MISSNNSSRSDSASSQRASGGLTGSFWPSLVPVWTQPDSWDSTAPCGGTSAAWARTKLTSSSSSRRRRSAAPLLTTQRSSGVRGALSPKPFICSLQSVQIYFCPSQTRSCFSVRWFWSMCWWPSKSCCWNVTWAPAWVSMTSSPKFNLRAEEKVLCALTSLFFLLQSIWAKRQSRVQIRAWSSCWGSCTSSSSSLRRTRSPTTSCWSCSSCWLRGCTAGRLQRRSVHGGEHRASASSAAEL